MIGVTAAIITAVVGLCTYCNEKNRDYENDYRETLFRILSEDIVDNKVGLKEIVNYDSHYQESIPIIINQLLDVDENKFIELKNYYKSSAILIGQPFYRYFEEYLGKESHLDSIKISRTTWLLSEFINNSEIINKEINLNEIHISDLLFINKKFNKLYFRSSIIDSVTFDGSVFTECDFSSTTFRDCNFWKVTLMENVFLKNVQFENCSFQESIICCKLDSTLFRNCNLLDMEISDVNGGIFNNCLNYGSIKIKR